MKPITFKQVPNRLFYLNKVLGDWELTESQTGVLCGSGKTQKEVIGYFKNSLKQSKETFEVLLENHLKNIKKRNIRRKRFIKYRQLFQSIFNQDIMKYYCDITYTLNIIAFDDFLGTPNGISCKEYIAKRFGLKASKLIELLLS